MKHRTRSCSTCHCSESSSTSIAPAHAPMHANTTRPQHNHKRTYISFSMALMLLASRESQVSSFTPTAVARQKQQTSINFRHVDENEQHNVEYYASDSTAAAMQFFQASPSEATSAGNNSSTENNSPTGLIRERMPTWLSHAAATSAETALSSLRSLMANSYLSFAEAQTVESAIREAAQGDITKVAGAADFLRILVETMEMGTSALVAAAFHYCACVTFREAAARSSHPEGFSSSAYWDAYHEKDHSEFRDTFGQHALQIAMDAAKLKRTEMVAASVVQQSEFESARPLVRDAGNMRSLLLSETRDWRALAIRSAACLYRLRGLMDDAAAHEDRPLTPEQVRVSREALHIYAPLASRLGMHRLKNELEGAAFRILYRRQYKCVTSMMPTVSDGMKNVLQQVKEGVNELLANDQSFSKYAKNVNVTARLKEPFSLWKKMLKMRVTNVLHVPDALALRVVLDAKKILPNEDDELTRARARALCYYAQEMCTKKYTPLNEDRFKDYIQRPKPNGYQSLHYTAHTELEGNDWMFEVQVRTADMHQIAEFGLAAHWEYKDEQPTENTDHTHSDNASSSSSSKGKDGKAFKLDHSSDAYLRSLQEWHWQNAPINPLFTESHSAETDDDRVARVRAREEHLTPYLKALMTTQSNLAREQVFVFLASQKSGMSCANGKIVALPSGSCILDAIRESERTLGVSMSIRDNSSVVYNGSLTNMNQILRNGDLLTIPILGNASDEAPATSASCSTSISNQSSTFSP